MPYPHQQGSPYYDGAEAFEAYLDDRIFVPCPACDGSAVKVIGCTVYEHGCGFPHSDTDEIPCPECDGRGTVEVEAEPVTLEDLD